MGSQVSKLKNEIADDNTIKNSPDFNSNDEPIVNSCKGNANSSEPKLLNTFASEKENLKYKINTSITLNRLLRDTIVNTYKNKLFKNQTT